MKKILLLIIIVLLSSLFANAQDIITKIDGKDIQAKVLEVSSNEVKYRLFSEPDGVVYTDKKSEILMIRYESGRNEVFATNKSMSGLSYTDREAVDGITLGMKYNKLKKLYNIREYSPALSDRYSPAWSGVASFFIPGLGQMICNEFGRGFLILGGTIAGSVLGSAFIETTQEYTDFTGLSTVDKVYETQKQEYASGNNIVAIAAFAGVLALDIFAIIDGVHVAKVKNMYEQDLKKSGYALEVKMYPSMNFSPVGNTLQPSAGVTLAMTF